MVGVLYLPFKFIVVGIFKKLCQFFPEALRPSHNKKKPTLYSFWYSHYCERVRLALMVTEVKYFNYQSSIGFKDSWSKTCRRDGVGTFSPLQHFNSNPNCKQFEIGTNLHATACPIFMFDHRIFQKRAFGKSSGTLTRKSSTLSAKYAV